MFRRILVQAIGYSKGGAPNSGRFLIPDKRSFMLDFPETHWCILANLIPQTCHRPHYKILPMTLLSAADQSAIVWLYISYTTPMRV